MNDQQWEMVSMFMRITLDYMERSKDSPLPYQLEAMVTLRRKLLDEAHERIKLR